MPIGAFARRCGLSISALRFYDECDVLKPAAIDPRTGYRSYAEDQLGDADLVRRLRRLEMPVAGIREFLAASSDTRHKALADHLGGLAEQFEVARAEAVALHRAIDAQEGSMTTTMSVTADELGRAVDQVLPVAGTDPKKPQLQALLVEGREGSVRLVATDSHRLAVRDLVADGIAAHDFRAVVRPASLTAARGVFAGDAPARLGVADGHLVVEVAGESVTIELVDDAFPDYEKLLVVHDDAHPLVVDRAALLDAIETDDDAVLWFELRPGALLAGKDASYLLHATYDGPPLEIAMNRDYALAAIRTAVGPDVVIEATSPVHPVVFRSATDGTFVHMVMPVRVRGT